MNPNEIQAFVSQSLQQSQQVMWGVLALQIALLIVGGWVLYMFYARLRDVADELRKIRVTYEMEQDRIAHGAARRPAVTPGENPSADDARYKPAK
jgi:hypothetical protein